MQEQLPLNLCEAELLTPPEKFELEEKEIACELCGKYFPEDEIRLVSGWYICDSCYEKGTEDL